MASPESLKGKTFNHLTIRELYRENGDKGELMAVCDCVCGTTVHRLATHVKNGKILSCGCARKNQNRKSKEDSKHWRLEEMRVRAKTAAHQHFLTTYRPNGGECDSRN